MDQKEIKALRHIANNGDDRNLTAKIWRPVKRSLWYKGFLTRRHGDWAWIATPQGQKSANQGK